MTSVAIVSFLFRWLEGRRTQPPIVTTPQPRLAFPMPRAHLPAAAGQTRSSRARARHARALGARRGRSRSCASRAAADRRSHFMDGPITANNPAGVHHGHGRTLKDVFQRYKALQGSSSATRTASTRRACGSRSRSRRRSASTRSARSRSTVSPLRPQVPRARRHASPRSRRAVAAARPVDGLGQRLLHLQRHEHRVHLALPRGGAPARLAVQGPPLDAVVPALRHVPFAARAGRRGELRRARAPVALRPLPAARTATASRS